MKANLAVAKEQLANYESIEKEIDDAIVGLGYFIYLRRGFLR